MPEMSGRRGQAAVRAGGGATADRVPCKAEFTFLEEAFDDFQ